MNRLAILCSGQGSQTVDMLAGFTDRDSRRIIEERLTSLPREVAARIREPCAADLLRGEVAQPALCIYAELAWKLLASRLPAPHLLLGYSLGELVAYAVAGALAWEDLARLALDRAQMMAAAYPVPSTLIAVKGLHREGVHELCGQSGGSIAIFNGAEHFVVGVEQARAEALCVAALSAGAGACRVLAVEVASHTSFLTTAVAPFSERLRACHWGKPMIPVLSTTSVSLVSSSQVARGLLSRQLSEPVRWSETLQSAIERGTTLFLELGPGSALAKMVRELHPEVEARSLADFQTSDGAARWCAARLG
jgi:[acyl-carrier-protein] S-malonyltransferase